MKPELARFFESMDAFFRDSRDPAWLRARFPGWDAPATRLAIYGRFVDGHVERTLEKLYPMTRSALGDACWHRQVCAYYQTAPARHFEMNRLGERFASFLADRQESESLPSFIPPLARFEWTDFEVFASEERIPEAVGALTPNPTLTVLQHPFLLVPWMRAVEPRPQAPQAGEETVLVWRHPRTHRTTYLAADSRALLVLKLAVEAISVETAAAAGGLAPSDVRSWVEVFARDGLVLVPPGTGG